MALSGQPEFEEQKRVDIARIVFLNGVKTISQENDVKILLTAFLCRAILVTSDGVSKSQPRGILGSKADLAKIGVRNDSERGLGRSPERRSGERLA